MIGLARGCFFIVAVLSLGLSTKSQQPFEKEIRAFKKQDSLHAPPKNAILFVGSSSFRLWPDIQRYFPGHMIINRGFGGASLPDVARYANDIILPYHPKQIFIYCGENDLASDNVTVHDVYKRFVQLFTLIRSEMKDVSIVYVSIKPSPLRQQLTPKMIEANMLVRNFLKTKKYTAFVDVYTKMIDKRGKPRKELFSDDDLHMNAKGYALWQKTLKPYLIK